jgi:hypothetical protein
MNDLAAASPPQPHVSFSRLTDVTTSATNEATRQRALEEWNARDLDGYLTLYDDRIQLHG